MIRGDTLIFTFTIENLEEDLTSCYFSCKKTIDDEYYTFQKSLEDGIEKIDTGKYKVRIAPADTREEDVGEYLYDLQIGIGEDIFTIMTGPLRINKEITEESYDRL
jgi:hypothetical protein